MVTFWIGLAAVGRQQCRPAALGDAARSLMTATDAAVTLKSSAATGNSAVDGDWSGDH